MSRGGCDLIKTEHREEKVNIVQYPYYSYMITLSGGLCSFECQSGGKKAKERNGIYIIQRVFFMILLSIRRLLCHRKLKWSKNNWR